MQNKESVYVKESKIIDIYYKKCKKKNLIVVMQF